MSEHLDLDALADALAGERSAHLDACADCSSRLAELVAAEVHVAATLAALPAPPLPAGLSDRLLAAVAAEPPLGRSGDGSVLPMVRSTRRRLLLPAAAAAVLAVGGVGLGLALTGGATTGADTAATAATAGSAADSAAGGSAGLVQTSSGTDWSDASAVDAVLPGVLDGTAGSAGAMVEAAPVTADALERLRTPEGLADCLSALADPGAPQEQPLAVDYARYAGEPAVAVLLPDPDPAQLQVFVVGAGCTAGADGTLFFRRVARP